MYQDIVRYQRTGMSSICWAACRPSVSRTTSCRGHLNFLRTPSSLSRALLSHPWEPSNSFGSCSRRLHRVSLCSAHPARFCLGSKQLTDRGGNQPPPNSGGTGSGGWGDGGAFGTSHTLCALASVPPSTGKEDVILLDVSGPVTHTLRTYAAACTCLIRVSVWMLSACHCTTYIPGVHVQPKDSYGFPIFVS